MFRKSLAALGVLAVLVVAFAVLRSHLVAAPTVTVGSGPVALIQTGVIQEAALNNLSGSIFGTLPVASTAGTTLIFIAGNATVGGPFTISAAPVGWTKWISVSEPVNSSDLEVWALPSNPGGVLSVTFTGGNADWWAHLSEWSNVKSASTIEASGSATATAGTTLTPATSTASIAPTDLVISAWIQRVLGGVVSFASPPGFTRLADSGAISATKHLDIEYQLNAPPGIQTPTLTSNTATNNTASGITLALKAATPTTDETAYLEYPGPVVKLNTADFNLMLGGRLLLESDTGSDTSGYQLEDGSGVIILDTYIPQLGDPVTITNPTWSGRVVSVQRAPIVERQVNYVRAVVAAINTAAAPGGTAPGDFSDVAAGGYYQLEDGSGNYQLEDGSGNYVLEGTTYRYRNLQLRQSQNQDGTTTTYGSLETFEGGFQAGQTFLLSNADLQLSSVSYTITNVTTSFVAIATPLYLIEFGDAYQTLQKAGGGVLTQVGSTAVVQQGAAVPAGTLAYAQVTANQGTFTAATDLTGLTVTVTVASGRRIQITGQVILASSVSNDSVLMNIVEGSTNLYQASLELGTTGGGGDTVFGQVVLTPTAGVHTYKLQGQRQSGTGNITSIASGNQPAFIMVEDIGT